MQRTRRSTVIFTVVTTATVHTPKITPSRQSSCGLHATKEDFVGDCGTSGLTTYEGVATKAKMSSGVSYERLPTSSTKAVAGAHTDVLLQSYSSSASAFPACKNTWHKGQFQ